MIIVGIDPGISGGVAVYDKAAHRIVFACDMPTQTIKVGRSKRTRLVGSQLISNLQFIKAEFDASIAVIEEVNGFTGQSASAAFVFGYTVGMTHACAYAAGLAVEVVASGTWKKHLKVPKDKQEAVAKACDLLPDDRHRFYNKRGTAQDGIAEAAMIAYWFATRAESKPLEV